MFNQLAALLTNTNEVVEQQQSPKVQRVSRRRGPRPDSKMTRATELFEEHFGVKAPKEIQQLLIEELGMSKKGAKTYYYTIKSRLGK